MHALEVHTGIKRRKREKCLKLNVSPQSLSKP